MNIIKEFKFLEQELKPLHGTVKATTYADSGTAIYTTPSGQLDATIASSTAMTNHIENTILESRGNLIEELKDCLPHAVIHKHEDNYPDEDITSIEAPHRIVSGWFTKQAKHKQGDKLSTKSFEDLLFKKIAEVGIQQAIGYFDPNSLLHGFMLTISKRSVNPTHSKGEGVISGWITAHNVTRVQNAGVAFDPVVESFGSVSELNNQKLDKDQKASGNALGYILIGDSHYVLPEKTVLSLMVNYKLIKKMNIPDEMKELICNLANYKVAALLDERIDIRRDTYLMPVNYEPSYDIDDLLKKVVDSCKVCKELGYINPNVVEEFEVTIKHK